MDELKFNCPDYLAQRFWKLCVNRKDTPGAVLRGYMLSEVRRIDPDYTCEAGAIRASDRWTVRATADER